MATFTHNLTCGTIAFFAAIFVCFGQANSPAPETNPEQKTPVKTPSAPSNNPVAVVSSDQCDDSGQLAVKPSESPTIY